LDLDFAKTTTMSDQPLLESGATAAAPALGKGRKNEEQTISTATGHVTCEMKVPRVNGEVKTVKLSDGADQVISLLEKQTPNKEGNKECGVLLSTDINVHGKAPQEIVAAAEAAHFAFRHFIAEYGRISGWDDKKMKEQGDLEMHQQFHDNVAAMLSAGPGGLTRTESTALLADFSSAQSLLEHGVEGYVKAVNKLLKTDLDESVHITFRDLVYKAVVPKVAVTDGYVTVASRLYQYAFGPCLTFGRAIVNTFHHRPAIEYEETPILKGITGMIKPGRLTLVLGPPGCGKTSFLRAISGKTIGKGHPGTVTEGDIRYNERDIHELKNRAAWVSYVGQDDEHQALLTVRETLNFAFKCRKASFYEDPYTLQMIRQHSGEAAVNRVKALKDCEVDICLALLGLSGCANTVIGNANLKGVSGGERRRVTMGEMLVTGSQIFCADEISTGLDSAATFDITAYLRTAAHALQKSILVALLQPPPEVIDLFDDIIVLAEGHIIYHGERTQVQEYFENLGFELPEGKDLGDFIVELPTRNGVDMMLAPTQLKEKGITHSPPETAEQFADAWKTSKLYKKEVEDIEISNASITPKQFDYDDMPVRSFARCLWDTLVWSMTLRLRDRIQIVARVIANIVVGCFFGTLFFQLTIDDWWLKAMLFLMALMFLVSTAFPTVQIISQQRGIFYKQVEAKFYSPAQFTLAQWLVSIPFVCFDVACFGCAMYWMCGLAPHFDVFIWFLTICISFGVSMNTIMTMFPFVTPNEETAVVTAALFLILSVVASGCLSTETMIPVAFRWMMWINPLAWSYRALAINEYKTPEYDHWPCSFKIADIPLTLPVNCQSYFLQVREIRPDDWYIPGALVVNGIAIALFLSMMTFALGHIRFEKEKTGATAGTVDPSKGSIQKRKAQNAYEQEKYLDAVSPRALHLSGSGLPMVSPMTGGNGDYQAIAVQPPSVGFSMIRTPPKTLMVNDLWYTIPINGEPIDFLKGVSFYAEPGKMTALMGSSGAGKTTLMDVISGRKTVGSARGDILVNGSPKIQHEFVKYTGYVEQFGVHANCATIMESLEFSANLRLPAGTPNSQLLEYCRSVMELLELDDIADSVSGGLSMEQNKRLTLGVEMVANPSIIFCDEPTSGLDARAAAIVMRVLMKVARSGRTIVCTIHQPSTAIFNFFDNLLLLKRGGEVVYFGELGTNSKSLIQYLQAVPSTKPCPRAYNPATWMLEVIGAGTGAGGDAAKKQMDYAQVYLHSELREENDARLQQMIADGGAIRGRAESSFAPIQTRGIASPSISPYYHANYDDINEHGNLGAFADSPSGSLYVRGQLSQIRFLLTRNLQTYWRSPEFSLNRLIVVNLFTGIFACFFYDSQLGNTSDLVGRIVNIFFFSSLTCIYNLYTLVPFALSRRALYYRERSANMYSVWAFNWAEGLVELPWIIVQVCTTVPLIYFLTNLNLNGPFPFEYFVVMITIILMLMTSMGLFAASLFPDALAAQLASVGALITLMVFCGIMVPKQNLPAPYVPLYYVSFFKYSSEGLMSTQFHGLSDSICLPDGKPVHLPDVGQKLLDEVVAFFRRYVPNIPMPPNGLQLCTRSGNLPTHLNELSGIQWPADDFVLNNFAKDYDYDNRYLDLGVLLGWILMLRILTFTTMYFVNHQKR